MRGILNLKNINSNNSYEIDLNKYNNTEIKILVEYDNTYEIETHDGSEYTIFKEELITI